MKRSMAASQRLVLGAEAAPAAAAPARRRRNTGTARRARSRRRRRSAASAGMPACDPQLAPGLRRRAGAAAAHQAQRRARGRPRGQRSGPAAPPCRRESARAASRAGARARRRRCGQVPARREQGRRVRIADVHGGLPWATAATNAGGGGAAGRERHHLVAGVGDEHGVLPLRRQRAVARDDGPAVADLADLALAGVDHRLDREDHARHQLLERAGPAVVQHLRLLVEARADAVAAELAHHREAAGLRRTSGSRGRCRPGARPA